MKIFRNILLLALVVLPVVSNAEIETKEEKLVRLAHYENIMAVTKRYRELCIEEMNKITPDKLVVDTPDFFGGIKPGSKYWPEAKSIYKKYINSSCSYLKEKEVLNRFLSVYSGAMSEEALNGILAFYESQAGVEYLKAVAIGKGKMQTYFAKAGTPVLERAMKTYTKELGALIRMNGDELSK